jgi:hypothetical protein
MINPNEPLTFDDAWRIISALRPNHDAFTVLNLATNCTGEYPVLLVQAFQPDWSSADSAKFLEGMSAHVQGR